MRLEAPAVRFLRPPEGVPLPFEIGSVADRLSAFVADTLLIHAAVGGVMFLAFLSLYVGGSQVHALPLAILLSFLIRNFYFSFFEIRWGGRTPGKRALGLRVVSRDGGALTAESVFARNLTRDLEVFLPVTALTMPEALIPGLPGWAALIATVWLFVFALLPIMNRDRLRMGDIVAGTMVVRMPSAKLLWDLSDLAATSEEAASKGTEKRFQFAPEQLEHYGIRELQVLEDLLRKEPGPGRAKMLAEVAKRVKKRIGFPDVETELEAHEFLAAFYKAQRARLEHKMLLGFRQERKKGATDGR